MVISGIFLILTIFGLVWFKCMRRKARLMNGNGNHAVRLDPTEQYEVLPFEVIQKLQNMEEVEYRKCQNAFNTDNCVICLDTFVEGIKVRVVPKCGHIFHSNCITEVLKVSHRRGVYRCPLCQVDL